MFMQKKKSDITLLLVDDESALLNILSSRFHSYGAQVFTALNGKEALEILSKQSIDIVITDLQMPVMNGIELLIETRKSNSLTPYIFFSTAYAENNELEDYFSKGVNYVFNKPLDTKVVFDLAKKMMSGRELAWSKQTTQWPHYKIQKQFSNINESIKNHEFHLGNYGFFLSLQDDLLPLYSLVHFKIEFKEGNIKNIEGTGSIQWTREVSKRDSPKGMGIFIETLSLECLKNCITYINSLAQKSTIPRN